MNPNNKILGQKSLPIEILTISEYNTRSAFIDQHHVEFLSKEIKEKGFHPNRSLLVNKVTDASSKAASYRVVAGMHRFYGSKKAGLKIVPCLIYENLTDEEEVYLDQWDNEMDESHKPFHFLEIADHYKYLQEKKEWSIRQIAGVKNVDKNTVYFRLKISNLPPEAKQIIRNSLSNRLDIFYEKYFQFICKLCPDHIIYMCHEIYTRGVQANENKMDSSGIKIHSMKQTDIKLKVDELLEYESQGKIFKISGNIDDSSQLINPSAQQELDFDFEFDNIFIDGWEIKPRRLGIGLLKLLTRSEKLVFDAVYAKTVGFKKPKDKISLSQFELLTGLGQKEIRESRDKLISKNLIVCEGTGNDLRTYSLNPVLYQQVMEFINHTDGGKTKKERGGAKGKPENNGGENPDTNTNLHIDIKNNNNTVIATLFNYGIKGSKLNECLTKIDEMGGEEYLDEKVDFVAQYKSKNPDLNNPTGLLIKAILDDYKLTKKTPTSKTDELFDDKQKKELMILREKYEAYVDAEIKHNLTKANKEKLKTTFINKLEDNKLLKDRKEVYLEKENEDYLFYGILRDDLKTFFKIMDFDKFCTEKVKEKS